VTAGIAHWRDGVLRKTKTCTLSPSDPTMRASRIMAGAFIVRRELLIAIGGYDERLPAAQNQDLGLRIIEHIQRQGLKGKIGTTDEVIIDVYAQEARSRASRYGDRYAQASRIFLERYSDRMDSDPRSRAVSLRIISR